MTAASGAGTRERTPGGWPPAPRFAGYVEREEHNPDGFEVCRNGHTGPPIR